MHILLIANMLKWVRGINRGNESVPEAQMRKLEQDFLAAVKTSRQMSLVKKEELKRKKNKKCLTLLENCKVNGDPVTLNNTDMLVNLSSQELLLEVAYLRQTVAPDIHQRRRVKLEDDRYKYEKFTVAELRTSIQNAVKPESDYSEDVNHILKSVFSF